MLSAAGESRRRVLRLGLAGALACAGRRALALTYPAVELGYLLRFPADHGAHPDFRSEWWYVTGSLEAADSPLGFQVTFFRNRPGIAEDLPVASAPPIRM